MHKRLFVPMAALAAALGPDAAAQEADTAGITLLPTIRIDSSGAQSLLGNDTISEEEIERRNADSVRDIFAGESSITTGGGAAIANKVFVNGIEESLLSVTIDGARQNKSAFHHTGNVLIDPSLLKRVEVTKGLAPADAGPGALGGSIAYELKDASDLLEDGDDFGGRLTIGGIPANEEVRGNLTLFGRVGGWDWLVSGVRHVGEDYENGSGVTVPGTQPGSLRFHRKDIVHDGFGQQADPVGIADRGYGPESRAERIRAARFRRHRGNNERLRGSVVAATLLHAHLRRRRLRGLARSDRPDQLQ